VNKHRKLTWIKYLDLIKYGTTVDRSIDFDCTMHIGS